MIDTPLTTRCRATTEIRSHQGLTRRFTEGTQYDVDNIGGHLFSVERNNGVTGYVFPFETEIIGEEDGLSVNINETSCEPLVEFAEKRPQS